MKLIKIIIDTKSARQVKLIVKLSFLAPGLIPIPILILMLIFKGYISMLDDNAHSYSTRTFIKKNCEKWLLILIL